MKSCASCSSQFEIFERDRAFYEKIAPVFGGRLFPIPEPTLCPACRTKRRMAFRNEKNMFRGASALSGKKFITSLNPSDGWKVYEREEWFGDTWNGTDFGRPYDFSRSFAEQFADLQREVPVLNLNTVQNENCSYCTNVAMSKNCYLIYGSVYCEDCYYGSPYYSRSCVDSMLVRDSELCYECVTCERCYNCNFCQDCVGSRDLYYCYDLKGCSDCIGCVGLRNKQFHIFNEQYSQEEYMTKKAQIFSPLGTSIWSHVGDQEILSKFEELKAKVPRQNAIMINAENCSGDYIYNSKNAHHCFDIQRCEDVSYCAQVIDLKDCYDCNYVEEMELCYEYTGYYRNQRCFFSHSLHGCHNVWYSAFCASSDNLFGCIGVKHGSYCILNKQYSKEEYEELVARIIRHMGGKSASAQCEAELIQKEWGEFFHPSLSYFGYNETVAQEYYPLATDEALKNGFRWR